MSGLIVSDEGLMFGTGLQFQTPIGGANLILDTEASGASALLAQYGPNGLSLDFTDSFFYDSTGFYGSAAIVGGGTQDGYDTSPDAAAASLLTYTSPSPKMTMGPSGTLRFGAHNLSTASEQFNFWGAFEVTITADQTTAPNGTTTADLMTGNSSTGQHRVFSTLGSWTTGFTLAMSVYGKANTGRYLQVDPGAGFEAIFDLQTGTITKSSGAGLISTDMEDVGNGWYRCTAYFNSYAGTLSWAVGICPSGTVTGGSTAGLSVYIWGLQFNRTPCDMNYIRTTSAARYALPYEWSTAGVLQWIRVEEARTNLCLYSDDLTNAAWTKSNMATAKTATGPDGVANSATTCTATAGNATALQAITSASAARITSVYIKRRTGTGNIDLTQDNGSTWATVTVTSSWTRVNIASVTSTDPTVGIRIVTSGDAVDVALFQHELGSFISSPIPTIASTVTRAADNISLATSAFPSLSSGFTLFCQATNAALVANDVLALKGATAFNEISVIYGTLASQVITINRSSNAVNYIGAFASTALTTERKMALGVETNNANSAVGGALAGADDASVTIPTFTNLHLTSQAYGGSNMNTLLAKVMVLPRRMTNAELQTLTTP